jgi:tRNA threonylcarbamoyladenosine biosynthesis protein TsaB
VDAIAFGRGPGAFTGVRIAIGVVQGLAFALERPVLPVSNLAALAQGALREHGVQQVAAAIDARMDEVYWGCYRARRAKCAWSAEAVLPPERWLAGGSHGEWFGAGTGWLCRAPGGAGGGQHPVPAHALDVLTLATLPGPVARQSSPSRRNRFICAIMWLRPRSTECCSSVIAEHAKTFCAICGPVITKH